MALPLHIKHWGLQAYGDMFDAMRLYTEQRQADTPDELWTCEHEPVFTQGLAGKAEHVLQSTPIPVVATNRGGQVTYHGPGQLVVYPLLDLRRRGFFVKEYVYRLEEAVLRVLRDYQITGHRVRSAPGIYVRLDDPFGHAAFAADASQASFSFEGLGKIAALGIKIHRHCCYHGLSLNVAMDLQPFNCINPCGYQALRTVDLRSLGVDLAIERVRDDLLAHLIPLFSS